MNQTETTNHTSDEETAQDHTADGEEGGEDRERDGELSIRDRLRRGDSTLYYVPVIGHPISINEFHAHVLGVVTGGLISAGLSSGFEVAATTAAAILVGYSLVGPPVLSSLDHDSMTYREATMAIRTVRYEPWHYLGVFILSLFFGTAV